MKNAPWIVLASLSSLHPVFAQQPQNWRIDPPKTMITAEQQETMNRILEMKAEIDLLLLKLPPPQRQQMLDLLSRPPDTSLKSDKPLISPGTGIKRTDEGKRTDLRFLGVFDTNQDGKLDSADPILRTFRLWFDFNRDGRHAFGEIQMISSHVAGIPLSSLTFSDLEGSVHSINADSTIMFDMRGDGFGDTSSKTDDAFLAVDTASLQVFGLRIFSQDGSMLQGVQTFRPGLMVETPDGKRSLLY